MKEKVINWMKTAPKISHTIRILAGAYLLYTSYGMFRDPNSTINAFVVIFGIIFIVVGLFFLITSLYALNKGCYSDYVDMSSFTDENEDADENAESTGENKDENDTQA